MHEFKIEHGNATYKIDVDNFKFIVGKNFVKKYQIFSLFKSHFNKISNSEYAIEGHNKRCCYFDNKPIDLKLWKYFEITPFFDLETDLKMGTKSLLSKYLDSFSDEFETNESFATLSMLISSLNEDYFENETYIEFGNKKLELHLGEITRNILFKEITPLLSDEELDCNSADLSYEELILLQLSLIEKIANKTKDSFIFINAFIPLITPEILKKIFGFKYENSFLLINTESICYYDYKDVYLCGKYLIDFADDENIIDNIMELPYHIEKSEFTDLIKNFLSSKDRENFDKKIVELFTK